MSGPLFHQTIMGRRFFEADVPNALRQWEATNALLARIAAALEAGNVSSVAQEREDIAAASAFVMREAVAAEVERLYGPEAAEQVRLVALPDEQVAL